MKRLRVLVMMDESLVPPASVEGMSAAEIAPFKTEYDVLTTLSAMGHEVRHVGVKTDLDVLASAIREFRPQVCFNLVEDFDGIPSRDQHVVSYLELIDQPYTGSNPRGLTLARDKALSKKVLSYHDINVPLFAEFPMGRPVRPPQSLPFPLLVKSLSEEGSVGIAQASVVYDSEQLIERVSFLHEKHNTDAIAEQYIEGRELYLSVLGNRKLQTFPIWELCLENLPPDAARIATAKVKWDEAYRDRHGIVSRAATGLSRAVEDRIVELGKEIYRTLDMSGYARIDLRLTPDDQIYLLEANPNPQIARGEDFADSAAAAGLDYESLLQKILALGLAYQPLGMAA
jgi:D-alanine-D-alanine ligase